MSRPKKRSRGHEGESSQRVRSGSAVALAPGIDEDFTVEEKTLLKLFERYGNKSRKPNKDQHFESTAPAAVENISEDLTGSSRVVEDNPSDVGSGVPLNAEESSGNLAKRQDGTPARALDSLSRVKQVMEEKRRKESLMGKGVSLSQGIKRKARINRESLSTPSGPDKTKLDPSKYPSSGLLISEDWHSATIDRSGDVPDMLPGEPLIFDLVNAGLGPGNHETLVMKVTVPPSSTSWGINICPPDHSDFNDVLFHFNPRIRFVALNDRRDGKWGVQEKIQRVFPNLFGGVLLTVAVQMDREGFHVAVDNVYRTTFKQRRPLPEDGSKLVVQVMTKDDFDSPMALTVHQMWWGHKMPMPGLPGSGTSSTSGRGGGAGPTARAGGGAGPDRRRSGEGGISRREEREGPPPFLSLHVSSLPLVEDVQDEQHLRSALELEFREFGIKSIRLFGESQFGFITFSDHEGAVAALNEKREKGAVINGTAIRVSKARTEPVSREGS
ncbi:unnamed protein product [Discosporangium mesarthrocarpum]